MKKTTNVWLYSLALSLFLVLSVGTAITVQAKDGISGDSDIEIRSDNSGSVSISNDTEIESEDNDINDDKSADDIDDDSDDDRSEINASSSATSSVDREDDEDQNKDEGDKGEEHRSRVANVVKDLLSIADRDGGIGEDIRLVAQEQASTSARVKEDMDEVEGENALKVFLFGSNFKSLGDLRSTLVTTENHINRLKKAEEKTTNVTVKAELSAKIAELEDISSTTDEFIKENESKFSLLGWLVRLFN